MKSNVVILGASDKTERYSYKALRLLKEYGHNSIPVHPRLKEIEGIVCVENLKAAKELTSKIDTLTVYVRPEISESLTPQIIELKPRRAIFNPGTENKNLQTKLEQEGVEVIEACTLVLLNTNQF